MSPSCAQSPPRHHPVPPPALPWSSTTFQGLPTLLQEEFPSQEPSEGWLNCLGSLCAVHDTSWKCEKELLAFLCRQSLERGLASAPSQPQSCRALTVLARSTNNFHCAAQAETNIYKAVESCTLMCFHLARGGVIIKQMCLSTRATLIWRGQ